MSFIWCVVCLVCSVWFIWYVVCGLFGVLHAIHKMCNVFVLHGLRCVVFGLCGLAWCVVYFVSTSSFN